MSGRHAKPNVGLRIGAGLGVALALLGVAYPGHGHVDAPVAAPVASVTSGEAFERLPAPVIQSLTAAVERPSAPIAAPAASRSSAPPFPVTAAGPVVIVAGIPATVERAYLSAEGREQGRAPGCHLPWTLLAGIGLIESGQLRGHGPGSTGWDGVARPPILGPVLSGGAFAAIADTDGGRFDGDRVWDRAVGPMQFIPSTWQSVAVDANGDGTANPQDISDAAAAAADYLCADGRDLATPPGVLAAVFSYNHSAAYVQAVLAAARAYSPLTPGVTAAALELAPGAPTIGTTQPSTPVTAGPSATAAPTPRPTQTSLAPTAAAAAPSPPAPVTAVPAPAEVRPSPTASSEPATPVEPSTTTSPTPTPVSSP